MSRIILFFSGITYIGSESWVNRNELKTMDPRVVQGVIGVSLSEFYDRDFNKYMRNRKVSHSIKDNPWLLEYMTTIIKCNPDNQTMNSSCGEQHITTNYTELPPCPDDMLLSDLKVSRDMESKIINAIDAMKAYAKALENIIKKNITNSGSIMFHSQLISELHQTTFINAHDQTVMFDDFGNPQLSMYDFINVQVRNDTGNTTAVNIKRIGRWMKYKSNEGDDLYTSSAFDSDIQYNNFGGEYSSLPIF